MTEEKNPPENIDQPSETAEANPASSHEEHVNHLNKLLDESKDAFLRAKAEAENIRRRAVEDVSKAHKFAIESFAEHLLPVMDSMHAALAHEQQDFTKLKEGIAITLKQLSSALEKGRITEINPEIGSKFDPHLHQAISMVPSEQEPNTVVTVLQRGYSIADRVLRPALVTVSESK